MTASGEKSHNGGPQQHNPPGPLQERAFPPTAPAITRGGVRERTRAYARANTARPASSLRDSIPLIGVDLEVAALGIHDTKTMPAGGFHNPPARQLFHFSSAKLLQALHLRLDIVGFDV